MDRERALELLSLADKCFEEAEFTQRFEEFGKSDEVEKMIQSFYSEYESRVEYCVENAPEQLKKRAEELKAKLTGRIEDFGKDVMANFKVQLYITLERVNNASVKPIDAKEMLEKVFAEEDVAFQKMTEVACTLSDILKEDFIFALYDGYAPVLPDPELKDFFEILGEAGLKAIPGELVIPGIKLENPEAPDGDKK